MCSVCISLFIVIFIITVVFISYPYFAYWREQITGLIAGLTSEVWSAKEVEPSIHWLIRFLSKEKSYSTFQLNLYLSFCFIVFPFFVELYPELSQISALAPFKKVGSVTPTTNVHHHLLKSYFPPFMKWIDVLKHLHENEYNTISITPTAIQYR